MILKSLHLENFKGAKDKIYKFGKTTRVSGMNRLGKTTIATAWFWLLADKNYELVSNPNIRPDDVEECVPTVTAVLDVDGKEIAIAKMQKRKVGKPDANGISKVTITNTYEINSVPKTERDFRADLEELGLSFDNFLVCSHPDVFTRQKQADMRKVLFKLASAKTDVEIAAMSKDTKDVAKLLEAYKYEEIEAMNNASKKKAVEQLDAIPNQIVGLEKAKVDVDVAEQELAKADLERKISEVDQKIACAGNAVESLQQEEMQLQFDMSGIMQTMNRELSNQRNNIEVEIFGCTTELDRFKPTISLKEKQIDDNAKANAISLSNKIQIVTRFYGKVEEIHKNYDFVHCTCAWSSWDNEVFLPPKALECIINKELYYVGSKYPLCSIIRTRKYIERGYHINAGQYVKMCMQLNELDLKDVKVLEEQLTGVDTTYFQMMVEALQKHMEETGDSKVDTMYAMELINKLF